MTLKYSQALKVKETPQSEPILGRENVMFKNNAEGFTFKVSKWDQLMRFLILGTENGTYYQQEHELTVQNAKNVIECIKEDGKRAVGTIVNVSVNGRAPKNDPAIFALALACAFGNKETKALAYQSITKVCRIGTHIFQFCQAAFKDVRKSSKGLRRGVAKFYLDKKLDQVAYQLIKYRQRDNWTHKDVIRLSHPRPDTTIRNEMFAYALGKLEPEKMTADTFHENHPLLYAFETVQKLSPNEKGDVEQAIKFITDFKLPWETLPTAFLNLPKVWEAILPHMPAGAMIRNLGKMTAIGLTKTNLDEATKLIVSKLNDTEVLKKARIHPLGILNAMATYSEGHGLRGKLTWNPVQSIVDALNDAFYTTFQNVESTGKNYLLGVDVSGSMSGGTVSGMNITPRAGACALALVMAKTEPNHTIMGFTQGFIPLNISKRSRLDDVIRYTETLGYDGTDCALPMLYAIKHKLPIDTFIVITDNETWAGNIQPVQALNKYRQSSGRPAKLIVVGMTASEFTIADPDDSGMLDIVGFDTAVPKLISDFSVGFGNSEPEGKNED